MQRLIKKIKKIVKKIDKARRFGNWKFSLKIKLPHKRDNDFYYESEKKQAKFDM